MDKIAAKIDCYGFKGIFTRLRDKYGQRGGFLAREEIGCGFHEQHDCLLDYLKEGGGMILFTGKGVVRVDDVVTLKLKDATVEKILDAVLRENGYNYEVVDKVVVVTRAKAVPVEPTVEVVKRAGKGCKR